MERQKREAEKAGQQQLEVNRQIIRKAANNADKPVDIDDILDNIFDFFPPDNGSDVGSAGHGPSAFKASLFSSLLFHFELFG